jgi:hypothetical protein
LFVDGVSVRVPRAAGSVETLHAARDPASVRAAMEDAKRYQRRGEEEEGEMVM